MQETNPSPNDGPARSLQSYVQIFARRKGLVIACLVAGVVGGVLLSVARTPKYQANAQVVLGRQNLANALTGTPDPNQSANDFLRIVATKAKLARSPVIAGKVAQSFPEYRLDGRTFLEISNAEPVPDADLLRFTVTSKRESSSTRLVNAYAQQFVAYSRQIDTQSLGRALAQLSQRIAELRREPDENARLITDLVSKEQELRTLEALQTSNATIVAAASEAVRVVPAPRRYVAVGLLLGGILAFLSVLAREGFDTRIRTPSEVESVLGLPCVGQLPKPPKDIGHRPITLDAPGHPDAEAFRILRTNLDFAAIGTDIRRLLITSCMPREGKTTTIVNLAVAMAQSGARVVLVDLDLRQPTASTRFGLAQTPGVTDVLRGTHSMRDALHTVTVSATPTDGLTHGELRVLSAGTLPPDPGELMLSSALREALDELSTDADFVLLDAPPVLPVGDAMAISTWVDAMFVVTMLPSVTRPMLESLKRALDASPARKLGFVVTGDDARPVGYGYGYGYGGDAAPQ